MYFTSTFEAMCESKWISTTLQIWSLKVSHFGNQATRREKNRLNACLLVADLHSNQSLTDNRIVKNPAQHSIDMVFILISWEFGSSSCTLSSTRHEEFSFSVRQLSLNSHLQAGLLTYVFKCGTEILKALAVFFLFNTLTYYVFIRPLHNEIIQSL